VQGFDIGYNQGFFTFYVYSMNGYDICICKYEVNFKTAFYVKVLIEKSTLFKFSITDFRN
jgi:hypothetical protein